MTCVRDSDVSPEVKSKSKNEISKVFLIISDLNGIEENLFFMIEFR